VIDYSSLGARLHHEPPTLFDSLGEPGHAHHFQDAGQQKEASTLGMWLFLGTEVMLFGGMFAGYFAYRYAYPHAWEMGSSMLYQSLGSINTAVLICSSFTMALAVRAAQLGQRKPVMIFLLLTIVLGAIFLGIKFTEYYAKFAEHLVPGSKFAFAAEYKDAAQIFFSFYFAMTGMHALHMIIGLGIMTVILIGAWRGKFSPEYHAPVEISGLYWHFVDIIWIFLFPLLYLLGRHLEHHG
jgi:cytochrome c oxidase subunit 3